VDTVTVMPRERQRAHCFALALEGAQVGDAALTPMVRVAAALGAVAGPAPTDDFRSALRQRLLAAGGVPAARPASDIGAGIAVPTIVPTIVPAPWRRRLVAAGTVLAITTGGAATTAVASDSAQPGDALYDVKLRVESVRLALAPSDLAKGRLHLQIAATRLSEVAALLDQSGPQSTDRVVIQELRKTLGSMASSTELGSEHVFAAYHRTRDPAVLAPLDGFVRKQAPGLAFLAPLLPPQLLHSANALRSTLDGIAAKLEAATGVTPGGSLPNADPRSRESREDLRPGSQRVPPPDRPAAGHPAGAVGGATPGAGSAVPDQGPGGLDVDAGQGGLPGVSLDVGSGSTSAPVPQPGASVGISAPTNPEDMLLGTVAVPTVSVEASLAG